MKGGADTVLVAAITTGVPALDLAAQLVGQFETALRSKMIAELDPRLAAAVTSLIAPFARGIARDREVVGAAIVGPWSNGQTDGQINKLKLVKRLMYGRAKIDLLEARLIGAN